MTAPLDIAAIRRRVEAATPGPWLIEREELDEEALEDGGIGYPRTIGPILDWEHAELDALGRDGTDQIEADAAFIAASRTDVPALCDALEACQQERDIAQAETDAARESLEAERAETARLRGIIREAREATLPHAADEVVEILDRAGEP